MLKDFNDYILIKLLCFVHPFLAAITFLDVVDLSIRFLTGVTTVVVSFFIIRFYITQYRLFKQQTKINELDLQIRQQTLYDQMRSNKKKHG